MALVEKGFASFQLVDSAEKESSASFHVSPAAARAYLAAADAAARLATPVGTLLAAARAITRYADFTSSASIFAKVGIEWVQDALVTPTPEDAVYRSNKWKVTLRTTNGGFPAKDTLYVPEYLITGVDMESDGISANLGDSPIQDFWTNLVATGLSKFNTAFLEVLSIQRNDD